MIVSPSSKGWEVIYHRAHALLAAQLAFYLAHTWRVGDRPARVIETIAAISHHDDLVKEWESTSLSEAGTPLDFTMPLHKVPQIVSMQPLLELIEQALYRGRWVALLVSKHCCFLQEPKRGQSKIIDSFLSSQRKQQRQWQRSLNITQHEAESAYAYMQWCDRLSLILAQRQLPTRERALEIGYGPDGQRYDVLQRQNNTLFVSPWPFDVDRFCVNVETSYLNQATFKSRETLILAMKQAKVQTLEWEFVNTALVKPIKRSSNSARRQREKNAAHGEKQE